MAISTGEQGGVNANINVTPMIDVMLVLLIIFMLVTPLLAAGFQATIPAAKNVDPSEQKDDEIKMGIDVNGNFFVDGVQLSPADAEAKLREDFAARPLYHLLHFKADQNLPYGTVQQGIEMARRAGASNLIAITDRKGGLAGLAEGEEIAMAMGTSSGGGLSSEINVTPMIDVLLVLLIIFMIVQMLSRTQLQIVIPPVDTSVSSSKSVSDQIVLELRDDGTNWINGQGPLAIANLDTAIHEYFDARPTKLLFIKPGKTRKYSDVIDAVDVSKGAGIQVFGFTPIEAYN